MALNNDSTSLFFVKSKDSDLYITIEDFSKLGSETEELKLGNIGHAAPMDEEMANNLVSILGVSKFVVDLPDQEIARSLINESSADRMLQAGLIDHKYDLVVRKHSKLQKALREASIAMGTDHLSDLELFHAAMDCSTEYMDKGGYVSDHISELAIQLISKIQGGKLPDDIESLNNMICDQYELGCLILIHDAQG